MSKPISLLHVFLGEEDTNDAEDFQYLVEKWKKANRSKRYSSRKGQQMQFCPDQQQLPFIREKTVTTTEDEIEEAEPFDASIDTKENQSNAPDSNTSSANLASTTVSTTTPKPSTYDKDFEFPRFSLINQHNFPFLQVCSYQQSQKIAFKQRQVYLNRQNPIAAQYSQNTILSQNASIGANNSAIGATSRISSMGGYGGASNLYGRPQMSGMNRPNQLAASPSSPSLFNAYSGIQVGQASRPVQQMANYQQSQRQEEGSLSIKNEAFFVNSKVEQMKRQRERISSEAQFIGQSKGYLNHQQRGQVGLFSSTTGNAGVVPREGILKTANIFAKPTENIDQKPVVGSISLQQPPTLTSSTTASVSVSASTTPASISSVSPSQVTIKPTETVSSASARVTLPSSASMTSISSQLIQQQQQQQQQNAILLQQQQQQRQLQMQRSNTMGFGGYIQNPAQGMVTNTGILNSQQNLQRSLQQQQQFQLQQIQQQQRQQSQIVRYYFNKYAEDSDWSVVWDPELCPNVPLYLDRSDRSIKFAEVNSHGGNSNRKLKNWSDMNFENTQYYTELFVSKGSRLNLNLRHSDPALNLSLIEPNMKDLENFHHPKFDASPYINRKLRVTYKMEYEIGENGEAAVSPFLKDLRSLSGRRGGVVVVEHTSEALPFIMNVGMASRLIIYWHKEKASDYPKITDEKLQILEPDQTSPFIAQIPRNEPVPSINCLLYSVPVAEHKVETTDFLLIKSIKHPLFYIKKFKAIYCAGFLEAHNVVMRPSTKEMQDFQLSFIKALLINIFRGTEQYPGRRKIQVSQLQQEFFPGVNEPKLRQVLRSLAKYKRKQGNVYWKRKDLDSLNKQFNSLEITPELVCKYQSMLVGLYKLRKNGVNIITRSKRVFQQIQNLHGDLTKKVAHKIEAELMKTPWARTENFNKAFQGHAVQIEHADDGSQIMRSKSRRRKGESISIDGKEQPEIAKPKLAGTDKDLRSLTLRELREKLMASGVPSQAIDEMSRWKQVDLLRQVANRQKEDGNKSELAQNYSRGPRNDYAASLDQYKKQYQQTFETNLSFINTQNANDNDELLDDGNILDDISLQMTRDAQDDEETDEPFELQEEMNQTPALRGSNGDPPELIPYGIFTYPTHIDWEKLGFANSQMRTVAKLITVSWNRIDGLHIDLHWKRSPPQIEALMKNPNVYQDQGQKAPMSSEDLEEYILKNQRKTLQDKIRRTKQAVNQKGPKALVQAYLTVRHQLPLINDTSGANNLTFHLTPDIMAEISEASERFSLFEQKNGKSHSKKKKSGHGIHGSHGGISSSSLSGSLIGSSRDGNHGNEASESEYDSDDSPEVTMIVPHQRNRRQNPVFVFNELLKKLLAKLLQKPGDEYWEFKKPVLKKEVPDYHNYVHNPICFEDIERKADNLEYTTISKFYSDVKQIDTNCRAYNTGRNDGLVALSTKMMNEFQEELSAMRDELDQRENEIDPVLRQMHE